MKKLLIGWLALALLITIAWVSSALGTAQAHEQEGAVAVCNWENFTQYGHDGFNWHWIACNHTLHTSRNGVYHSQWRGGIGTPGHTVTRYKHEAAAFRAYTGHD